MKDVLQLVAEARRLRRAGRAFAVATVVKINGSTYRRPGARMLVAPGGGARGMISGGCLEEEVAQRALRVLRRGAAEVISFDLTKDDPILGFGAGCNGVVYVLIEPVPNGARADPLRLVEQCLASRRSGVMAQVIGGAGLIGRRLLVLEDGAVLQDPDSSLPSAVLEEAHRTLRGGQHTIMTFGAGAGMIEVLFEIVRPPIRLVIFGSGYDVAPVARLAGAMGWPVVVVGRQPAAALAESIPAADEHIFLMHPEEALSYVSLDERSACVVMNHQYVRDKALVGALLKSPVPYIGMLGPHDRALRIKDELPPGGQERIYGPIGLDIGTETPEEIALSIVAEIQAVMHGRSGASLREGRGLIHEEVCAPLAGA